MTSNSTRDVLKELDALREAATAGPYAGTRGLQVLTVDGLVIAPSVYAGVKPDKPYKPDDLARCRVNAQLLALAPVLAKGAVALARAAEFVLAPRHWSDTFPGADDRYSSPPSREESYDLFRARFAALRQAIGSFLASLDEQLGKAK